MSNALFFKDFLGPKTSKFLFSTLFSVIFCITLPIIARAAPPVAFDGWSENAGIVSAPCPANFECINGVSDQGILQRTIRSATGEEYIQLVVVGVDQTGTTITDESFVRMGGLGPTGIAAKQTFNQIGTDQLTSQIVLNLGWANDGTTPAIGLSQSLISSYLGVSYNDTFSFEAQQDANGVSVGSFTSIRQTLLDSMILTGTPATGQDVQTFVFRRASGVYTPSAGQATLQGVMGGMGGMGGMGDGMMGNGAGGTVTWNAGDDVQVMWIGQLCEGCQSGGMGGGGMGGGGMGGSTTTFSYQSFDNLVDAQDPIATASIVSTDPFTWPDPPFGVQPTLQ